MSNKYMTIEDMVMRIIGDVVPIGSSHIDEKRFENLEELINLTDRLVFIIDDISTNCRNSNMASVKKSGMRCYRFLDDLGIE